jgi:CBS domain-containing protein
MHPMNVADCMQPHVMTAHALTPAGEVAAHMVVSRLSGFPATNDAGSIVTELDLIREIRAGNDLDSIVVDDIMTRELITVSPSDSLDKVMQILDEERIIRVTVVTDA